MPKAKNNGGNDRKERLMAGRTQFITQGPVAYGEYAARVNVRA
jgi:hypothetical protein